MGTPEADREYSGTGRYRHRERCLQQRRSDRDGRRERLGVESGRSSSGIFERFSPQHGLLGGDFQSCLKILENQTRNEIFEAF